MLSFVAAVFLALAPTARDTLPTVERAVQAAVIDSLFVRDTTQRVVLGDSSISGGTHFVDEDYRSALQMLGVLPAGLQSAFEAARAQRRAIGPVPARVPIVPFDAATKAKLYQRGDPRQYWEAFYRQFPGAPGWIELSRPGFSARGDAALILVEYGCGSLCGGTLYVLLEYRTGRWHVSRVAQPRMS